MPKEEKPVSLREFIEWVKQELRPKEDSNDDQKPWLRVNEVTVEVNFTVEGDIDAGFDLRVVKLGSKVGENRVQKATIKMTPIRPSVLGETGVTEYDVAPR